MIKRAINRLVDIWGRHRARRLGVEFGAGVRFHGQPNLFFQRGGAIRIGARASLISDPGMTALAVSHPVVLRLMRAGAVIDIGPDVGLSGTSICSAISVAIGAETMIGADVIIADSDFHALPANNRRYENRPEYISAVPVVIGRNVFIGARSIILKGVTIGDNSVIGAGSIVTRNIPANVIAAGNPCRILKPLPETKV
jgi:acetyltransferase-like isoleucine patch superfamily enzyme